MNRLIIGMGAGTLGLALLIIWWRRRRVYQVNGTVKRIRPPFAWEKYHGSD